LKSKKQNLKKVIFKPKTLIVTPRDSERFKPFEESKIDLLEKTITPIESGKSSPLFGHSNHLSTLKI
jgi:hypothetical protein